jgi:hypothetical protein
MMDQHEALSRVLSGITAERIKSVMSALARIPSPLTELLEVEPVEPAHVAGRIDAGEMHGAHSENFSLIAATKASARSNAHAASFMLT